MIVVKTRHPLAVDSPDHVMPHGTRFDRSRNRRFNSNLYRLFPLHHPLKVLDLGCAGGSFVQDIIDDGYFAVGLEGSNWSKKQKRAAWAHIPDSLFTCDIGKAFVIYEDGIPVKFDVVTAWEVLEHIRTEDVPQLMMNIKNHLLPTGLFIGSVSTGPNVVSGVNLHQTVWTKEKWISEFKKFGFVRMESHERFFRGQFIRGGKIEREDPKNQSVLFFSASPSYAPSIPRRSLSENLFDWWYNSRAQRFLKRAIV